MIQAGFGPTDEDIAEVKSRGYEGWIDDQLAKAPYMSYNTYLVDQIVPLQAATFNGGTMGMGYFTRARFVPFRHADTEMGGGTQNNVDQMNLDTAFMRSVVHGEDVLRKKTFWTLLQLLVTSKNNSQKATGRSASHYLDLVYRGAFSDYGDLLGDVSMNCYMGFWLSSVTNIKEDPAAGTKPDENYAREIMQLFTMGLYDYDSDGTYKTDNGRLIETYTNQDVTRMAKVFTGLVWASNNWWTAVYREDRARGPMFTVDFQHDQTEKVLFPDKPYRLEVPAGMNAEPEIRFVCEKLSEMWNTAVFVSRHFIRFMVTSNPTPEYVQRVAQRYLATNGNLGQTVKAVLLDPEARGPRFLFDETFGKVREPYVRFLSTVKNFEVGQETDAAPYSWDNLQFWNHVQTNRGVFEDEYDVTLKMMGQGFFNAQSVFNYFKPEYQEPGEIQAMGMVSPEMQILSTGTAIGTINFLADRLRYGLHSKVVNSVSTDPQVNYEFAKEGAYLDAGSVEAADDLVDRLNLLMAGGMATHEAIADYRQPILKTGSAASAWNTLPPIDRVRFAVLKLFADSSAAVQR